MFIKIFIHGKRDFRIRRDHILKLNIGENVDLTPYELEQQSNVEDIIEPKSKIVCT